MRGADQDIGEALVVAQRHVVARLQLLDQVGLEQQRLGLRLGGDEHHRARLGDHPRDAGRLALRRHVGGDAFLDRAGLPDIEHLALGADHAVDPRPGRGVAPEFLDRFGPSREARRLGGGLVEADVERRGVRRELPLERRFRPRFGFGRLARRIAFRRARHGAYLGRPRGIGNSGRPVRLSPPAVDWTSRWNGASTSAQALRLC